MENEEEKQPRLKPIIEGAQELSLGISIVVAVLIGVGIGMGLKKLTGIGWLLWVGVGIGIAAAIANIYKAYSKQYKEFEALAKDPRYNMGKNVNEDDDDED